MQSMRIVQDVPVEKFKLDLTYHYQEIESITFCPALRVNLTLHLGGKVYRKDLFVGGVSAVARQQWLDHEVTTLILEATEPLFSLLNALFAYFK